MKEFLIRFKEPLNTWWHNALWIFGILGAFAGLFVEVISPFLLNDLVSHDQKEFIRPIYGWMLGIASAAKVTVKDGWILKAKKAAARKKPEPEVESILGCTEPDAANYNPEATLNDGTCYYAPEPKPEENPEELWNEGSVTIADEPEAPLTIEVWDKVYRIITEAEAEGRDDVLRIGSFCYVPEVTVPRRGDGQHTTEAKEETQDYTPTPAPDTTHPTLSGRPLI